MVKMVFPPKGNWEPLKKILDENKIGEFMHMLNVEFADGRVLYAYKHIHTRRYLFTDSEGNTFNLRLRDGNYSDSPEDLIPTTKEKALEWAYS
jgi:hypothetical protein